MHPDQKTPDDHRYTAPDSTAPDDERAPEQPQRLGADTDADDVTSETVATPDPEEKRLGEAGNQYTGRQMDDALKSSPRVDDADDVTGEA